jgi:hydrogenase nickel incorporation protein HypA/HybF
VSCQTCGAESAALPNRLVCGACGDWRTTLLSGDELILESVELEFAADAAPAAG